MPRRSAAAVADTRAEVLDVAVRRASIDGLEGLTIGRLADEVSMSKSGLHGLFGSKEDLQIADVRARRSRTSRDEVWRPVAGRDPGLPRLLALIDRWIAYHRRRALPGGCFVTTATIEFDARPGPLRDAVARRAAADARALAADIRTAVEAGDLPAGTDPADAGVRALRARLGGEPGDSARRARRGARARRCMRALVGAEI